MTGWANSNYLAIQQVLSMREFAGGGMTGAF